MANERARWLRKHMTRHEVKLWVQLRYLKQYGYHFRRQAPIGPYIIDFAEKRRKLVIEVDGSQHGEDRGILRDVRRDRFLNEHGYKVLRFWNGSVATNMDGIIETILAELESFPRSRSSERGKVPEGRMGDDGAAYTGLGGCGSAAAPSGATRHLPQIR